MKDLNSNKYNTTQMDTARQTHKPHDNLPSRLPSSHWQRNDRPVGIKVEQLLVNLAQLLTCMAVCSYYTNSAYSTKHP